MLMVGTIQNLQVTDNTVVLNFSSLNEKYPKLDIYPPRELPGRSEYEFDMAYAQYIMSNDMVFFDFMQIPYNLYLGKDVFILIDDDARYEFLNESLLKFIQQRYGYNANYITCAEDFIYAEPGTFSEIGMANLIYDKERLSYIAEKSRLLSGGVVGAV